MEIISKNETTTAEVAKMIATETTGGDILALRGDLGTGKTTFTKYFAKALGVTEEITSPTFVIMKSYDFSIKSESFKLIHIDAYRLTQADDVESIGLLEIMNDKNSVIVIEWPEKIWSVIKIRAKLIDFEYVDEKTRKISTDIKMKETDVALS